MGCRNNQRLVYLFNVYITSSNIYSIRYVLQTSTYHQCNSSTIYKCPKHFCQSEERHPVPSVYLCAKKRMSIHITQVKYPLLSRAWPAESYQLPFIWYNQYIYYITYNSGNVPKHLDIYIIHNLTLISKHKVLFSLCHILSVRI